MLPLFISFHYIPKEIWLFASWLGSLFFILKNPTMLCSSNTKLIFFSWRIFCHCMSSQLTRTGYKKKPHTHQQTLPKPHPRSWQALSFLSLRICLFYTSHIDEITGVFFNWLHLFLRFFQIVIFISTSLLFMRNNILWMDITTFYLFISWWIVGLLLHLGFCE